jgi:hypothetical protein
VDATGLAGGTSTRAVVSLVTGLAGIAIKVVSRGALCMAGTLRISLTALDINGLNQQHTRCSSFCCSLVTVSSVLLGNSKHKLLLANMADSSKLQGLQMTMSTFTSWTAARS